MCIYPLGDIRFDVSMIAAGIYRQEMTWERDFTVMPNSWIRDNRISFKAKGLLQYLLSHTVGYGLTIGQIERQTKDGSASIRSALDELVDAGYLTTQQTKDARGYNSGLRYELLNPDCENPSLENPSLENPSLENRTAYKKTNTKENNLDKKPKEKEILLSFETFYNHYPNARGKTEALKAYRKAITKLSADEINQAAIRFANDPNLPIEIYIPMPQTWLNQERWADPPLPENPLNTKPAKQTKAIGDW